MFDRIHYVASGKLGLWDTLPLTDRVARKKLASVLRRFGGACIEADGEPLYQHDDSTSAALKSILDKIASRGYPTLVDLDLENELIESQSAVRASSLLENTEGRLVGASIDKLRAPAIDIIKASARLLASAPDDMAMWQSRQRANSLGDGVSAEEDLLYDAFGRTFGAGVQSRLRRQVEMYELLGRDSEAFSEQRVDFAIDYGPIRCIVEVDGEQHQEEGQRHLDGLRDEALQQAKWKIHRVSASEVRTNAEGWWRAEWLSKLDEKEQAWMNNGNPPEGDVLHAAKHLIVHPHLVHQSLRGWVQLLLYNVLPVRSDGELSILLIEEDDPGGIEALAHLLKIWQKIATLGREIPDPIEIRVDLLGASPLTTAEHPHLLVREVDQAEVAYDIIVSRSTVLYAGEEGPREHELVPEVAGRRVRFRRSSRTVDSRKLQWAPRLDYDLEDLETALRLKDEDDAPPIPKEKYDALRYFLQYVFRKNDFWDGQARVVSRLLRGEPAVVLLPTGGGKSLTYQFSGLLLPGVTLVIDPLVALMEDQVDNMVSQGLDRVGQISSILDRSERDDEMEAFERGERHVLFVSPERLQIPEFRNTLQTLVAEIPISLAVIDEVHCVSEWGHDFRPSYLHLGRNIERYCSGRNGSPPTLVGLTGTASFAVLTDVQMELGISEEEAIILPRSFDRKELTFHVEKTDAETRDVALKTIRNRIPRDVRANPQTFFRPQGEATNGGIIFCPHVNGSLGVVQIAGEMGHGNFYCGRKPKNFDGDDWEEHKLRVQRRFKHDELQELVATKSFGMGIDKPNIRYTIHYGIPQSVEGFYQEAGRAGRNGRERWARCYIVYADDNFEVADRILSETEHRQAMKMLDRVNWRDRGDILHQLWFLLNTYADRSEEKQNVLSFWREYIEPETSELLVGGTHTVEIPHGGWERRSDRERATFRLVMLGIVEEYAVDWSKRIFLVKAKKVEPQDIVSSLRAYLVKYKFEAYADDIAATVSTASVESALEESVSAMVDFIYDEIVAKRKQALRTMAELCRNFQGDEHFRESILAYLQESEFSELLRKWVNTPFDQIGIDPVVELLDELESLEQVKRLVGTTRRMLDEDPYNVALRMVSVGARVRSEAEGKASVLQEFGALLRHLRRLDIPDTRRAIIARVIADTSQYRSEMADPCVDLALRVFGDIGMVKELCAIMNTASLNDANREAMSSIVAVDAMESAAIIEIVVELTKRRRQHHV